jgi:hypothetical protein
MSDLWTQQQLDAWNQEAELDVVNKLNLIIDRLALPTYSGQTLFQIPNYCLNISRVTYLGFKLEGKNMQEMIESQTSPSGTISYSRPLFYVYNGYGSKTIRVLPAINQALGVPGSDLFNSQAIAVSFIIEFYRTPDFQTDLNRVIQPLRQILVKYYSLYRALQQDGSGLDLKGSDFFKGQYELFLKDLKIINQATFLARISVARDGFEPRQWKARPILPPDYPVVY